MLRSGPDDLTVLVPLLPPERDVLKPLLPIELLLLMGRDVLKPLLAIGCDGVTVPPRPATLPDDLRPGETAPLLPLLPALLTPPPMPSPLSRSIARDVL